MRPHLYFLLFLAFFSTHLSAQRHLLRIDGKVREGKEKLSGVKISLLSEGEELNFITTESNGRFLYKLPLQANYMLVFSKRGYRSKFISIIAENIPEFDAAFGYEFGGLDVTLFKEVEGLKDEILDQPIAKIIYDTVQLKFIFDATYFEQIQQQVDSLTASLEEKQSQDDLLAMETAAKLAAEMEEARLKDEAEKAKKRLLEEEKQRKAQEDLFNKEQDRLQKELEENQKREEEMRLKQREEEKKKAELARIERERLAKEIYEKELLLKKSEEEKTQLALVEKERIEKEKIAHQKEQERLQELAQQQEKEAKEKELEEYNRKKAEFLKAKALAEAEKKKATETDKNTGTDNAPVTKLPNETYKQGLTEKVYRQGNKTIIEKVIVKGSRTDIFRKVTADWGGVYFFMNDISITEREYVQETEKVSSR